MPHPDRITVDPETCHGQPTVRGLRYPVVNLLELLASGDEHRGGARRPDLEREDLIAALEHGAVSAERGRVVPLDAA